MYGSGGAADGVPGPGGRELSLLPAQKAAWDALGCCVWNWLSRHSTSSSFCSIWSGWRSQSRQGRWNLGQCDGEAGQQGGRHERDRAGQGVTESPGVRALQQSMLAIRTIVALPSGWPGAIFGTSDADGGLDGFALRYGQHWRAHYKARAPIISPGCVV